MVTGAYGVRMPDQLSEVLDYLSHTPADEQIDMCDPRMCLGARLVRAANPDAHRIEFGCTTADVWQSAYDSGVTHHLDGDALAFFRWYFLHPVPGGALAPHAYLNKPTAADLMSLVQAFATGGADAADTLLKDKQAEREAAYERMNVALRTRRAEREAEAEAEALTADATREQILTASASL